MKDYTNLKGEETLKGEDVYNKQKKNPRKSANWLEHMFFW